MGWVFLIFRLYWLMIKGMIWLMWMMIAVPLRMIGKGGRRRRRTQTRYWTHPGCAIRHTRQDTAARCRLGR
ncbi:hypothetical protein KDL01_29075 [Actinospica durhamensis]|uniref:Uncharacterized protein n=1 Tax=Actinospica durhamensis TaxID=1508375 RepID=A0A941EVY9_9ACTN|nr:hypothetical protein [Actinospica durhamensis]MBR7837367.1 hypothetical protein [Actinospica durhamensis]